MIKVSVIVPCYNVQSYIDQCLTSIKNQTLTEFEVICVNDGSTDETLSIIQKFCLLDDRFCLINKPNTGYGDSMNMGLQHAIGEYIAIIEPDDFIESEMLDVMYKEAKACQLDVCRCNYYFHTKNGDSIHRQKFIPEEVVCTPKETSSIFKQAPSIWANIYRRKWLLDNEIKFLTTPGASYQDISFSFKTFYLADRFKLVKETLHHYRIDNINSSIHSRSKTLAVNIEWKEILNFAERNKINVNQLIPIMNRNYIWNLGRLDGEGRSIFVSVWQKEVRDRVSSGEERLLDLPLKTALLELIVLYFPNILLLYKKQGNLYKLLRYFYDR